MLKYISIILIIIVAACSSYTPLYAKRVNNIVIQKVSMEGSSISKNVGTRRVAQRVRTHLKRYFANSDGDYYVVVNIKESTSTVAVKRTAVIERASLNLQARLEIFNVENDQSVFNTLVDGSSVYNILDTPYATDAGRSIARQNAADTIASEIVRVIEIAKIKFSK